MGDEVLVKASSLLIDAIESDAVSTTSLGSADEERHVNHPWRVDNQWCG